MKAAPQINIIVGQNVRAEEPIRYDAAELQLDWSDKRPEIREFDTRYGEAGQPDCTTDEPAAETAHTTGIHHRAWQLEPVSRTGRNDCRLRTCVEDQDEFLAAHCEPNNGHACGESDG
jgi:hypothetical protein